jgi:hypothetical protein
MTRKFCAALAVLALASCFGRVSAWASAPGDSHACCAGDSPAPAKAPAVAECCAVPAAAHAVKPLSVELSFIIVAAPAPAPAFAFERVEADASGPPGRRTFRRAVPARAPPLA